MARLDDVLVEDGRPAVLVAHSLGCQLVAAWAAGHSAHTARVQAAMLVAPPDLERVGTPPILFSWRPIVLRQLPFPSLVVTRSDDPYSSPPRARQMAAAWGAAVHDIGARGHINGASELGDWPEGHGLLLSLVERAT